MRFGTTHADADMLHVKTEAFTELCRKVKGAFTRIRKMTLFLLIMTILERKGRTLSMEIRHFQKVGLLMEKISKVAYLKQRQKLNPLALLNLCQFHNRRLYDHDEMKMLKGYLLLAVDGSNINIPTTKETLEKYGSSSRIGTKPQASMGLSCLYDCINKTVLTCSINRVKFNEAIEAEKHHAELPSLVGDKKSILTLDRGYPSLPLLFRLNNAGQKFVIRLASNDFKQEQADAKTNDEIVNIKVTNSRLNHYKGTDDYDMMASAGFIALRMVKFTLPSGDTECLLTNLSEEEFSTDEIIQIYRLRWCIETAFDTLKNKLCIENFTGTKPDLLEQDIYASIYICNLASDMIADAQAELDYDQEQKAQQGKPSKHNMVINCAFAIGILKDMLINAILAKSAEDKEKLFRQMIEEAKSEVLPVRPNRQFNRSKGTLAGKFANSRKRVF